MRVAVVSEGVSDAIVVEAVARHLEPAVLVDFIWPDTSMSGRPFGWRGVRSWCNEFGPNLEVFMRGVAGLEYDVLALHADCSMAHLLSIANPCPPAATTANALGAAVLGWLPRAPTCWIVPMTPSLTTDAWIAAALAPPYMPRVPLECDPHVEKELARRHLLPRRNGEVKKPRDTYRKLVADMMTRWDHVTATCEQAAAFEARLTAAFACVAAGRGPVAP